MICKDYFILADEFVDADQGDLIGIEIGFFLQFARDALLRRFAALHETGDQGKGLFRPGGIARQQYLPSTSTNAASTGNGLSQCVQCPLGQAARSRSPSIFRMSADAQFGQYL